MMFKQLALAHQCR